MTDVASDLDQKLTQLAPAKARLLERLVREAMALADASDVSQPSKSEEAAIREALDLRVYPLPLDSPDFERLHEALNAPTRDLPLDDRVGTSGRMVCQVGSLRVCALTRFGHRNSLIPKPANSVVFTLMDPSWARVAPFAPSRRGSCPH